MTAQEHAAARRILLATRNPGKQRELASILAWLPAQWETLDAFPDLPAPVEDGTTFLANATKKALHYARLTGLWTLAEDSGLEVDHLRGAPGVESARFAGPGADDQANNARLVAALAGVPLDRRTAHFRCAAVLASPEKVLASAQGHLDGRIIDRPRGRHGFGYDPHFFVPSLGRTTAELDPDHKNRVSHRGRAVRALIPHLRRLLARST